VPSSHPNGDIPSWRSAPGPSSPGQSYVRQLLDASLILAEDWEALPKAQQAEITLYQETDRILEALVKHGLLTEYQADRIQAGSTFGLVLGNYRVLDRIGAGGMGIVFKGEHVDLRRPVAIKVFLLAAGQDPGLLSRFLVEMRAIAQLHHPNVIAAMDAGTTVSPNPGSPSLRYFVMEYVAGKDLEGYVKGHGPLDPIKACDLVHQVASALAEVHKYNLVHRDIKPSNVLVTAEEQAKLLDFGLARNFATRLTEPGMALGTIDFMAPEQARDASKVDIRADIYGLGGTLFWCLTGKLPFPAEGSIVEDLVKRMNQPPPSVRTWRPDVSAELDRVVQRMMAIEPDDRFPTPEALMQALLPFLKPEAREYLVLGGDQAASEQQALAAVEPAPRKHRALVIDDEQAIRSFCRHILQGAGISCDEVPDGEAGLNMIRAKPYDIVLLDVDMPKMTGPEVLRQLREAPPCPHLKVLMFSGRATADDMAQQLLAGADDYLTKPFSLIQLQGRVKAALRLKDAQDRAEVLNQHLLRLNAEQERTLQARSGDLVHARNALVLALAKLVEHRDNETGAHLVRLQRYCRCLAQAAAESPHFAGQIDQNLIEMVECCAPLHDIGKLGLPDHILLKPGKLSPDERVLMQAHTTIGADTLGQVAEHHGFALAFLQMAIDITRHHHERYDGMGYPDRLAGNDIPLAARIVSVGDVYDALRSRRVYKPALSHTAALQLMNEGSSGHFDPNLLRVFNRCAAQFAKIYQEAPD
jgi:response regulator RpfG family c-di-GMP phosphodiesterase